MKNRKMMKTVFVTIGILILVLVLIILGRFAWCKINYTPQRIYELNWNLQFPEGTDEEYNLSADQDSRGEGLQYTIFGVDQTKIDDFIKEWQQEESEEFETGFGENLDLMKVPADHMPHFEHPYAWKAITKHADELFMLYDFQENMLYVLSFIK